MWLLEELGIEYNLNLFERQTSGPNKHRAPDSLKESHPIGKSPQLITPEGRVIIERSAIAKYLIDKYDTAGKFKINQNDPDNDIIREEELMSLGGTSLSSMLMIKVILGYVQSASPFFIRPVMGVISSGLNKGFLDKEIDVMLKYLDGVLKGKEFLLNTTNPTRTDFCTLWYLEQANSLGLDNWRTYPNLKSWFDRCKSRDGWKRALEKGNGFDMRSLR